MVIQDLFQSQVVAMKAQLEEALEEVVCATCDSQAAIASYLYVSQARLKHRSTVDDGNSGVCLRCKAQLECPVCASGGTTPSTIASFQTRADQSDLDEDEDGKEEDDDIDMGDSFSVNLQLPSFQNSRYRVVRALMMANLTSQAAQRNQRLTSHDVAVSARPLCQTPPCEPATFAGRRKTSPGGGNEGNGAGHHRASRIQEIRRSNNF